MKPAVRRRGFGAPVRLAGKFLAAGALLAAAAATGDPLASVRRVQGVTQVGASGAVETVMLLAQLAAPGAALTDFQAQARARFAAPGHAAVEETAALLTRGFSCAELARFATLMGPAPHFGLLDSPELAELAERLPPAQGKFNQDRLHGYARLVREFYWDRHVGRFLRSVLPYYQQAVKRPLPAGAAPGAKVLVSPLAPATRIEFTRPASSPALWLVIGEPEPAARSPLAEERGAYDKAIKNRLEAD